jgi:hypothetical protein
VPFPATHVAVDVLSQRVRKHQGDLVVASILIDAVKLHLDPPVIAMANN